MKQKKKSENDEKFVVYLTKTGRMEKGIYPCRVWVCKDKAFVLPKGRTNTADVVPSMNVFSDRKEAESYLAGTGVKRWVVGDITVGRPKRGKRERLGYEIPVMFEALVVRYQYGGPYRNEGNLAVKKIEDGKLVEIRDTYGFKTFETKVEAEKYFKTTWEATVEEVQRNAAEYQQHLHLLLHSAPSGADRPLPVPSPDLLIGALRRIVSLPNNNKLRSERGNKAVKIAENAIKALGV